jgi:hypothetical protein
LVLGLGRGAVVTARGRLGVVSRSLAVFGIERGRTHIASLAATPMPHPGDAFISAKDAATERRLPI